jgi:putative tryptophan/tyrosine transport system substrate-binding protein
VIHFGSVARVRRREFVALLAGGLMTPALGAHGQPDERGRIIGVLVPESEPNRIFVGVFRRRLAELGWAEGHNARIELVMSSGDGEALRRAAQGLLARHPDILFTYTNLPLATLIALAPSLPIVFAGVGDPVGNGFVESLAHPGRNVTGFMSVEPSFGGKWLDILKEIVPGTRRVLVLFDPGTPGNMHYWEPIESAAKRLGVEPVKGPFGSRDDIIGLIDGFAATPGGAVLSIPSALSVAEAPVIVFEARYRRLPTIFASATAAEIGGLIGYGPDFQDSYRQAAGYVDRVLRGAKPGDLPVQMPTKFTLAINHKTAAAIGLTLSESTLARADEVIE